MAMVEQNGRRHSQGTQVITFEPVTALDMVA